MREYKAYVPVAHPGDHLKKKIGKTAYDTLATIASAPAGGTVAGLKVAGKVKKIYDTWHVPKPRKKVPADALNHPHSLPIKPGPPTAKPRARPRPPPAKPQQVKRPHRGW
jgi:hypothetical protein